MEDNNSKPSQENDNLVDYFRCNKCNELKSSCKCDSKPNSEKKITITITDESGASRIKIYAENLKSYEVMGLLEQAKINCRMLLIEEISQSKKKNENEQ